MPIRKVPVDEWVIADSAYALLVGSSWVPPLPGWAHIVPEFATINFHYTPAYFYLLAASFGLLGFSAQATGILHFLLRLLGTWVFFSTAKRLGLPTLWSAMLTVAWATFVEGDPGRPEDLAFLWVLVSVYLLAGPGRSPLRPLLAGVCVGLAFLSHPLALPMGAILDGSVLIVLWGWRGLIGRLFYWGLAATATACLWLIWIIPFWNEFVAIFVDFVLKDAEAGSYLGSLKKFWLFFLSGKWTPPCLALKCPTLPMQYSLVPLATLGFLLVPLSAGALSVLEGLLGALPIAVWVGAMFKWTPGHLLLSLGVVGSWASFLVVTGRSMERGLLQRFLLFVPLILIPLLLARNQVYWVPFRWFNVGLMIVVAMGFAFVHRARPSFATGDKAALVLVAGAVGIQAAAGLVSTWLPALAAWETESGCGADLHAALLRQIPPGEKVLSTDGYAFYHLRRDNPVYWPAGMRVGAAVDGSSARIVQYDASYRWALFPEKVVEGKYNPGNKFPWDAQTYRWFAENFELVGESTLASCAGTQSGLQAFFQLPQKLFLYRRKP